MGLCDVIHVTVWEPRFFLHHAIALAGYGTSELANVFALANAVNTWITEVGSLMYSAYLLIKSERAYIVFVLLYTLTRAYFAVWSCTVFGHVWKVLRDGPGAYTYPFWAPYCAASLQTMLLSVNIF